MTAWDSDRDARLFAESYAGLAGAVAASAGFRAAPRARRTGRDVIITSPELFGLASRVAVAIRRARVSTLPELRAHFEVSASGGPESP